MLREHFLGERRPLPRGAQIPPEEAKQRAALEPGHNGLGFAARVLVGLETIGTAAHMPPHGRSGSLAS